MGAIRGPPRNVVEELVLRVRAEMGGGDLLVGQVRHQRPDVVDAVVDDADRPRREPAVAAGFALGRRLQHQHGRALLARRQRRTECRIAGAHHDHVSHIARHFHPRVSVLKVDAYQGGHARDKRRGRHAGFQHTNTYPSEWFGKSPMQRINVLSIEYMSAEDRAKIEAVDPAIQLTHAGGWYDGGIRETWPAFALARPLAPDARGAGTPDERARPPAPSGAILGSWA